MVICSFGKHGSHLVEVQADVLLHFEHFYLTFIYALPKNLAQESAFTQITPSELKKSQNTHSPINRLKVVQFREKYVVNFGQKPQGHPSGKALLGVSYPQR